MKSGYLAAIGVSLFVAGVMTLPRGVPETIVNPADFVVNSFKTALLSLPGTVVNPRDFPTDSFRMAFAGDRPGTVVDPRDFPVDSFKTALLTNDPGTALKTRVPVAEPVSALLAHGPEAAAGGDRPNL